jgi:hypothetical protein
MSTLMVLLGLFSSSAPVREVARPEPAWAVRDYLHYSSGPGFAAYSADGRSPGPAFQVTMRPLPAGWGQPPEVEETAPTMRELSSGVGFGLILLLMIVVPLGSTVVFLRPRGVTWWSGSQRITRAEARAMLGRF